MSEPGAFERAGWAPVQGYGRIPWEVHEKAHREGYARDFPGSARQQPPERIAQRGGFGIEEMDSFYPGWREAIGELKKGDGVDRGSRGSE